MLQAARTPGLNIHTYSVVEDVKGFVGNFTVKIRKKARYVNKDCNGCGACWEVCPTFGYNEFNEGLDSRKAIYSSFAQAVPSLAQIDMDRCIKCELCIKACEVNAIDLAEEGYEVHLVERSPTIGGKMAKLDRTFPTDDCSI